MAVEPEDPVAGELDALVAQPEIRQRLDESARRFRQGATRKIPHDEVRRRLGLAKPEPEAEGPQSPHVG